jgi:alpha-galactosidase
LEKLPPTFSLPALLLHGALYPYWAGALSDGVVIGLVAFNGGATLFVNVSDVPNLGSGNYSWKEAYSGKTGSGTFVRATLTNHDMAVFREYRTSGVTIASLAE